MEPTNISKNEKNESKKKIEKKIETNKEAQGRWIRDAKKSFSLLSIFRFQFKCTVLHSSEEEKEGVGRANHHLSSSCWAARYSTSSSPHDMFVMTGLKIDYLLKNWKRVYFKKKKGVQSHHSRLSLPIPSPIPQFPKFPQIPDPAQKPRAGDYWSKKQQMNRAQVAPKGKGKRFMGEQEVRVWCRGVMCRAEGGRIFLCNMERNGTGKGEEPR